MSEQPSLFDPAGDFNHREGNVRRARGMFHATCSCGWTSGPFVRADWHGFYWRVHVRDTPRVRELTAIVRRLGRYPHG